MPALWAKTGLLGLLLCGILLFAFCQSASRKKVDTAQLKTWWAAYLGRDQEWETIRGEWLTLGDEEQDLLVLNLMREMVEAYKKRELARMERARTELVIIGAPAVPSLIQSLSWGGDFRTLSSELLILIGEPALDPLIQALEKDDDVGVRKGAAKSLSGFQGHRIVEALKRAGLRDRSWQVRVEALASLAIIRDPESLRTFQEALYDKDAEVQKTALRAFRRYSYQEVRPYLEEALQHFQKQNDLQWSYRIKTVLKEQEKHLGLENR